MIPFAVIGTAIWVVLGLVLLPFRGWLHDHGHTNWLWTCLAGALLGIMPGLYLMIRHDRHRQVRRLRARQAETRVDEQ
ncbi:DUF2530 domain-containing protein [Rugosimonospora africana]|nr:DUF2530 domain-containing protein [Rugosimonospora africana]